MAARIRPTLALLLLASLTSLWWGPPGWAASAQTDEARQLTLPEAIRLAWEQGPTLAAERRALAEAELAWRQAGVPYRTQAGLTSGYTVREGQEGAWTVSLTLDQSLALQPLLGGTAPETIRQAEQALREAERSLAEARQDVAQSVLDGYLKLLEARAAVARSTEALRQAEAVLAQTELRASQGAASQADLLEARAEALAARQNLAQAQLDATRAQTALNRQLGLPLRAELELAGLDLAGLEPAASLASALPSVERLIAHALEHRADLLTAREALQQAQITWTELKRPFEPTLALNGGYRGQDGSVEVTLPLDTWELSLSGQARLYRSGPVSGPNQPNQFTGWSAGISVGLPLLDGGSRQIALEQHRLTLERLESQLAELEATVAEEVRQAHEAYLLALEALPARELQLEAARIRLEAERIRFDAGVITPRQLAEAQAAYQAALSGATTARYDLLRAAAALQRAAGLPVVDEQGRVLGWESFVSQEEE